jgi:hypothetical protein
MVPDTSVPYPLQLSSLTVLLDSVETELLSDIQTKSDLFFADLLNKPRDKRENCLGVGSVWH